MSTTRHVAIVYHSGYGHTAKQAEAVLKGASQVAGVSASLHSVDQMDDASWQKLDQADAIIFGSPTYMGSVSAPMKAFMDASSKVWMTQKWKDKLAAGFTNSGSLSGDKLNSLIQLMVFACQHSMLWVSLGLMPGNNSSQSSSDDLNRMGGMAGAMAQSDVDAGPDIAPPQSDLDTAAHLGKRVAELCLTFKK
ncbi:MAG: flavodoxin family protein [Holosporales bacterium]